ncbi:N-acetylmuramoyl-L-alanine amidase [Bacillus sp. 71mf]|nr:N-acetylmuramoyl-L-alanine amidase [Bacillus sp. 71mf]SFS67940.1 N-acetylmuramoyl-L-alanine amidase [Bacillus sp. 103mf]
MKAIKLLCSVTVASITLLTSVNSAFADSTLIIPDLPKEPYRNGVGKYEGVVAHSTATPEVSATNIQRYQSRTWGTAFVHYVVDWDETIQTASTKYRSWGAGPTANERFVQVELSETKNPVKFKRSYERYVKLLAEILRSRNIHPSKGLWTHKDVTYKFGGTDHEDPLAYLASHGVSEAQFRADVLKAYNGNAISSGAKVQQSNKEHGVIHINRNNVNLRSGPSTSNHIIRKVQKGEVYKVWGESGNWLKVGKNHWIYNDASYIRYTKK